MIMLQILFTTKGFIEINFRLQKLKLMHAERRRAVTTAVQMPEMSIARLGVDAAGGAAKDAARAGSEKLSQAILCLFQFHHRTQRTYTYGRHHKNYMYKNMKI